ncbi:hypothetical protein G6031_03755 [Dietzia sp. CQ4]|uniref:MazG-like family protein n=1 Tax=Dietzia TaxID=37914 RepID=UPI0015FB2217|nr:hypothetical protein [Dietzia sp. CQ4]
MAVADDQLKLLELQPSGATTDLRRRRTLAMPELAAWAERTVRALSLTSGLHRSSDMFVLAQAVKLTEELGELHAEILGRLQLQRSSKHRRFNEESLRDELADVILSTAILSQAMGIDLDAAIRNKMNAVDSRMDD